MKMISVNEAKQIILQPALPKNSSVIGLSKAFGLVIYQYITESLGIPNFAQPSMDI